MSKIKIETEKKEEVENIRKLFMRERETEIVFDGQKYFITYTILSMGEYMEIINNNKEDLEITIAIFNKSVKKPTELKGKAKDLPVGFVIEAVKKITDGSFLTINL